MKKTILLFCLTIFFYKNLIAVPAYPKPILFSQPDGNTLTVYIKGDEWIHWNESLDGYTLILNQSGYLSYAQLDEDGNLYSSDMIATDIEERNSVVLNFLNTIEKKLFYSEVQQQFLLKIKQIEDDATVQHGIKGERGVIGQYKTLCAFVQFPNKSMIKTISQFEGLMNQLGYTGNGSGSVRDFFKEVSYNQFDLIITLCGVYSAPHNESYYAGNDGTQKCQELAKWAAQQVAAESSINFADYDKNNDGVVDGFHFIFAGLGQEASSNSGDIWSHKWQFSPPITKNGKTLSIYSCSPELLNGTTITTIGVICHEMTHNFGAADYYDTNDDTGGQFVGTGKWDLMGSGNWNGSPNGNRPSHPNMYIKVQFGWIVPVILSSAATIVNMPNSAENQVAFRINTTTPNEHYLLENRQRVKFDTGIPGDGLLIYHVHSTVGNEGINDGHPQRMYPVCASSNSSVPTSSPSSYGNINLGGCLFPGSSNKTSFTDNSTPAMKSWAGANTNKPITNIKQTNKYISFDFMGGGSGGCYQPTNLVVTYTSDCEKANLSWSAPTGVTDVSYNIYREDDRIASNVKTTTYTDANFNSSVWHTWSVKVACPSGGESNPTVAAKPACSPLHTISATAGSNGTISPSGAVYVQDGTNQTFNITSNTGFVINQVLVDGTYNAGAVENYYYTFPNVKANHTITVTFKPGMIPVTNIINLPETATAGISLTLKGTVVPSHATYQTIKWSIVNAGTTGATITGNTFIATTGGNATLRATIVNGKAMGTNYTKDFQIKVTTVGMTELSQKPGMVVFPNPTTGVLNIIQEQIKNYELEIGTLSKVEIFDIFGRKLSFNHLINTSFYHLINISHLSNGIYFLKVDEQTIKVIKN